MNLSKDPEFVADYLNGMIVQQILTVMEDGKIKGTVLAEKLGMPWLMVYKLLNESEPLTLPDIAKFCCALDCNVEVVIKKEIEG